MSELLDNQVDTQNENLQIKILGFMQAIIEVVMKEIRKLPYKISLLKGEDYKAISEDWLVRFRLRVTDSILNEGTNSN